MRREEDCVEPGSEATLIPQGVEFLEGPDHGALEEIIAIRGRAAEPARGGRRGVVDRGQELEQPLPAGSRLFVVFASHPVPFARLGRRPDLGGRRSHLGSSHPS